jgi:metal-responsive CopG/Arc/MetJ family transcriptional regulator
MKIKTSITLSEQLLANIDELRQPDTNRSAFIEEAMWTVIHQMRRDAQTARDIEIINRRADYLNEETQDALSYQAPL